MNFHKGVIDRIKTGLAVAGLGVLVYSSFSNLGGGPRIVEAQSDIFLSRRIDQVEQRFYSLESRLNRIEMESRQPSISAITPATNEVELQYLRSQIDSLRTRLGEAECGVLKLDERTLPAAQRRAAAAAEPCRKNWGERILLSARPGQ